MTIVRRGVPVFVSVLIILATQSAFAQRVSQPTAAEPWQPSSSAQSGQTLQQQPADPNWTTWPPSGPRPAGINVGGATIYPAVTAGTFYDSNVFAANSNRRSDWAAFVRPELGVTTSGQNYRVAAQGFVEARDYKNFNSENQVNGAGVIGGIYMPDPDTQILGRFRYVHGHEERGVGESELTSFDRPVAFNTYEAAGAVNKRFGRWWTSVGVANLWVNYGTSTIGGIGVDQSYRDGQIGSVSSRVGYVVAPLTSIFVEWSGNRRDFQVDIFDSKGYRVVGGVLLEEGPGARVKGELYGGYMTQDYVGATFQTVSTWTYGGTLGFILTPEVTATFGGRRVAAESALNGGVSVVETLVGARVDFLIAPNLVIGGGATYLVDEFYTAGRTDHTISPLASLKYFITPSVTFGIDYRRVNFDSSGFGVLSYFRDVVLFSLHAKL